MTHLLKVGAAWLAAQMNEHAAASIAYSRGAASVSITAHVGRTEIQRDGAPVRLSREWRDYFVDADDLVLTGIGQTLPAAGDRIAETDGSTVYVFEVMAPTSPGSVYDWAGAGRQRLRIHAKQVDTQ